MDAFVVHHIDGVVRLYDATGACPVDLSPADLLHLERTQRDLCIVDLRPKTEGPKVPLTTGMLS